MIKEAYSKNILIDNEFRGICKNIVEEDKKLEEWKLIESDDCFSTTHYEGGFDSTEEAFCFSYYDENKEEWWFQVTLDDIKGILSGLVNQVEMRPANT